MAVLRICALLLLFDCQEAFHCCLVVACINRINMISIECHRSGERCPGKREFDNRIEINRVRSGEIMWLFPLTINNSYADSECLSGPSLFRQTFVWIFQLYNFTWLLISGSCINVWHAQIGNFLANKTISSDLLWIITLQWAEQNITSVPNVSDAPFLGDTPIVIIHGTQLRWSSAHQEPRLQGPCTTKECSPQGAPITELCHNWRPSSYFTMNLYPTWLDHLTLEMMHMRLK